MVQTLHQLVHTLSYGDAISGEALALQRCLRQLGYESELYAINVHPNLKGMAHDLRVFDPNFIGELLIHYSLGSPLNEIYRNANPAKVKRSLIYHNLTPTHWFYGINPRIVKDLEAGAKELPELCALSDRLIADSRFNARELAKLGFQAQVLELPVDFHRWEMPRNEGIYQLIKNDPGIHLIHVGRLAPNKCIEDIIKTFFFLHHKIEKRSKLWIVGIDIDTELYSFTLKRLVDELDLTEAVNFVGCLADSELKSLYEAASAYLCMSEHEGFCLPVVEAMYFGLPVVAFGSSALPETVGSGGILVGEKRHPELAQLIYKLHTDSVFRAGLVSAGKRRAEELNYERFCSNVSQIFSPVSERDHQIGALA